MRLWKMHGCGNDFLLLDNRGKTLEEKNKSAFAARICDRHFGVGADGFIALEDSDSCDIRMSFFNADGTEDTMCGNGIRCLVKFARDLGVLDGKEVTVETADGVKHIKVTEESERISRVVVDMGGFSFDCSDIGIECEERTFMEHLITLKDGTKMRMSCVRLGVNHGVIYVDDDRDYPALYGEEIENLPIFLRDMNVNFTRYIDPGHIEVKTWERGVGKTLACGTGSSSAALITSRLKETEESIHVTVPGGELVIRIEGDTVYMEGPAEKVAEIEI